MATQEKQKRGGFLSFYKSFTKNHKPKPDPVVTTTTTTTNNNNSPVSASVTHSLLLKKLESFQELQLDSRRGGGGKNDAVEARKSVSHVESNLASSVSFLQVKVLLSDMPGFMQVHAFRCARRTYDSLETFSSKHIAYNLKKEFDKVYGPAWHCIVGSGFGSYVTHSTGCFLYFSMEKLYILMFKTKVQKALEYIN